MPEQDKPASLNYYVHWVNIVAALESYLEGCNLPHDWGQKVRLDGDDFTTLIDAVDAYHADKEPHKPRLGLRTCVECGEPIPPTVHNLPPRERTRWGMQDDAPQEFCAVEWCKEEVAKRANA